jgi:hypothetical protein
VRDGPEPVGHMAVPVAAYRSLSLWHETVPGPLHPRPQLSGRLDVDVAVVGAGCRGWVTAPGPRSRSRCGGGSARTAGLRIAAQADRVERRRDRPSRRAQWLARFVGG